MEKSIRLSNMANNTNVNKIKICQGFVSKLVYLEKKIDSLDLSEALENINNNSIDPAY